MFTDTTLLSHHDGKSVDSSNATGFDKPSFMSEGEDDEPPFEFEENKPVALNAVPMSLQLMRPTIAPTTNPKPLMPPPCTVHSEKDIRGLSTTDNYLSHARNIVADLYKVGSGSEPDDDVVVERKIKTVSEPNKPTKIQEVTSSMTLLNEELKNNRTRYDDRNDERKLNDNLRCYELGNLIDLNKMPLCNDIIPKTEVETHNLTNSDDLLGKMSTSKLTLRKEPEDYVDINNARKNKKIDWNDMFDTEILSQADLLEDVTFDQIQSKEIQMNISSDLSEVKHAAEDSTKVNPKGIQIISDEVIEPETLKNKTGNKSKAQTKVTDKIWKKVKKIPKENNVAKEPSFKKQSYKKSVTNWLETIEPCGAPDTEAITASEIDNEKPPNEDVAKILTKYTESKLKVDKSPKDKKKRVIQAQLANKDGVMKFKKPNPKLCTENNKQAEDITESSEAEVSVETKESTKSLDTDKPKPREKKPKTKFVAPIKSQIPVKDVTYDVVDLDEINLKEHLTNILDHTQSDITLVVTYK